MNQYFVVFTWGGVRDCMKDNDAGIMLLFDTIEDAEKEAKKYFRGYKIFNLSASAIKEG